MIIEIHKDSKERYGAPKIHQTLLNQGIRISLKRVQRLMKKANIRSITYKKFRPYEKKASVEARTNLLERDFSTSGLNQKWVTDITYIHTTQDGWCYLASVMDLHSRKIIGYSFSTRMTTDIVMKALNNAYQSQRIHSGLVIHSDLGTQYTSAEVEQYLQSKNIQHSFSQKGCPYDNACIESFHAILKKEEVHHTHYPTYKAAKVAIFQYIEGWYNRKRIHGCLGYKTPQEFEESCLNPVA
jgi:transposase InsO family protein